MDETAGLRRVYLDTNIVSRIFDGRVTEIDANAMAKIGESNNVALVISQAVLQETQRTLDPTRRSLLRFALAMFDHVRWQPVEMSSALGAAALGAMTFGGGGWTHPLLAGLRSVFDADDANHIAQAKLSDCAFFLTLDEATILSRRTLMSPELVTAITPMKIVNPRELVQELSDN